MRSNNNSFCSLSSLIVSYFFTFWLFWAPLCLVVGAKKYFSGALYKNSDDVVGSPSGPKWVVLVLLRCYHVADLRQSVTPTTPSLFLYSAPKKYFVAPTTKDNGAQKSTKAKK